MRTNGSNIVMNKLPLLSDGRGAELFNIERQRELATHPQRRSAVFAALGQAQPRDCHVRDP